MLLRNSIKTIFQSPWFIALILLGIFWASSSYKYGWDDQHLEVPLLKHLIDAELYQGDYYVESLKENFSSFFYPILAKLITVDQIPAVYFILYIVSRFFMFFWIYKIWLLISDSRLKAFACTATFILIVRVPEFLYRTFSHQEFALAIIFAGIYFFFKERFYLAALILGLAANIHALYSLFPMFYLGISLLFSVRKRGVRPLVTSCAIFILASLPFVVWTLSHRFQASALPTGAAPANWLELFILACPQNFFFPSHPQIPFRELVGNIKLLLELTDPYTFLFVLFLLNLFFNKGFRQNRKALAYCVGAFFLLLVCLIFTYFFPVRLMIDLNLARNTQFLLWLLMGYTTLTVFNSFEKYNHWMVLVPAALFPLYKFSNLSGIYATCAVFFYLYALRQGAGQRNAFKTVKIILALTLSVLFITLLVKTVSSINLARSYQTTLIIIYALILINAMAVQWGPSNIIKKKLLGLFVLIPLACYFVQFSHYKTQRVAQEEEGGGFWQLQRNWEDMQLYVKGNTPKDAMILVPYNMEMGGFRILSERKIVCSYRDCGLIGFDYNAAVKWQQRIRDIEPFKVLINQSPVNAIQNAVTKYDADYIVFMNYAAPNMKTPLFKKIYNNSIFTLYKINK